MDSPYLGTTVTLEAWPALPRMVRRAWRGLAHGLAVWADFAPSIRDRHSRCCFVWFRLCYIPRSDNRF